MKNFDSVIRNKIEKNSFFNLIKKHLAGTQFAPPHMQASHGNWARGVGTGKELMPTRETKNNSGATGGLENKVKATPEKRKVGVDDSNVLSGMKFNDKNFESNIKSIYDNNKKEFGDLSRLTQEERDAAIVDFSDKIGKTISETSRSLMKNAEQDYNEEFSNWTEKMQAEQDALSSFKNVIDNNGLSNDYLTYKKELSQDVFPSKDEFEKATELKNSAIQATKDFNDEDDKFTLIKHRYAESITACEKIYINEARNILGFNDSINNSSSITNTINGDKKISDDNLEDWNKKIESSTERLSSEVPSSWVNVLNEMNDGSGLNINIQFNKNGDGRCFMSSDGNIVINTKKEVSGSSLYNSITHESGHVLENEIDSIHNSCNSFLSYRTKGEKLVPLGEGYARSEETRSDNFINPYMGKSYDGSNTEIFSMGLEKMFNTKDDVKIQLYQEDPQYYHFIVGLLAGAGGA